MSFGITLNRNVIAWPAAGPGDSIHRFAIIVYTCALALPTLLMVGVAAQPWVGPLELVRDPLMVAQTYGREDCCHIYYGFISNLGILVWWTAAASCALSACALLLVGQARAEAAKFLIAAAAFTAFLALDDLYQLHGTAFPKIGVAKEVIVGGYAACAVIYLWRFREQLLQNDTIIFLLAGVALATSVAIDAIVDISGFTESVHLVLIEDGTKFVGICLWSAFHFVAALRYVLCARVAPDLKEREAWRSPTQATSVVGGGIEQSFP